MWRSRCINLPNFVKIGQTVVDIWIFFVFLRWRLFAILDLQIPKKSNVSQVRNFHMHRHAKFSQNHSNGC